MQIDNDAVDVRMERGDDFSSLEINIELPAKRVPPQGVPRRR